MSGRNTLYSAEVANLICEKIATSNKGLRAISKEVGIGLSTITDWLRDKKEFSEQYARAKEAQADLLAEEIIEISDDKTGDLVDSEFGKQGNAANVQRSKLQVEARKWIAAKLKPKKYGDKVEVEQNVNVNKLPDWLTQPIVDNKGGTE